MKIFELLNEDLRDWFKEKWVDISRKEGGKHPPCGASSENRKNYQRAYPKCVPASKAKSMSAEEKRKAVSRKRRAENAKGGGSKKPQMVKTKS